jgi:hypothetical protein
MSFVVLDTDVALSVQNLLRTSPNSLLKKYPACVKFLRNI